MKSELTHIEFYFPKEDKKVKNKQELADLIVSEMREKESLAYSGHPNEESLKKGIIDHLGNAEISSYKELSDLQKKKLKKKSNKL